MKKSAGPDPYPKPHIRSITKPATHPLTLTPNPIPQPLTPNRQPLTPKRDRWPEENKASLPQLLKAFEDKEEAEVQRSAMLRVEKHHQSVAWRGAYLGLWLLRFGG